MPWSIILVALAKGRHGQHSSLNAKSAIASASLKESLRIITLLDTLMRRCTISAYAGSSNGTPVMCQLQRLEYNVELIYTVGQAINYENKKIEGDILAAWPSISRRQSAGGDAEASSSGLRFQKQAQGTIEARYGP